MMTTSSNSWLQLRHKFKRIKMLAQSEKPEAEQNLPQQVNEEPGEQVRWIQEDSIIDYSSSSNNQFCSRLSAEFHNSSEKCQKSKRPNNSPLLSYNNIPSATTTEIYQNLDYHKRERLSKTAIEENCSIMKFNHKKAAKIRKILLPQNDQHQLKLQDTTKLVKSSKFMIIATTLLVLSIMCSIDRSQVRSISFIKPSQAYQLTNNLIANNLPPKFITSTMGQASNSEIVVRVKEGSASIGKLIYTLKGEDPDEDPITFGVLGSMASDLLRIENVPGNQANVYLRKELDRETTESYQVVITLTDGKLGRGNWITKSMLIIVEDVNDNYPVFGPHRTAISIREDVKVPLIIETIEATDQDEGRFGQVIYKLDELDDPAATSNGGSTQNQKAISSMFSIENIDGRGVISLISPLDYEQRALYQLRILAVDRAIEHERLTATTSILISVEDCEDQPPMFTFVPSITRIPENLPIGSSVVRVTAIDGDRGINNQIQYKLISVNGQESGVERDLFAINQESGQVTVAHELDRESSSSSGQDLWSSASSQTSGSRSRDLPSQPGSYVLQVKATELSSSSSGGSKQDNNAVSTELTVILTDVNDETPTFNQPSYYGEILENSAPESLVTFVMNPNSGYLQSQTQDHQQQQVNPKVIDRDQGTNGTFTLHLEGEHSQLFDIWPREATNEANFMIKVSSNPQVITLDYERIKMFQFNIVAREKFNSFNGESLLRSNSVQMIVHVKDSNDNYPQFESELYRVEIPENAIRGMHICAVKATDADSGLYGTQGVRYTEIRGEKANKFKLDPQTGVITLKTNDHGFDRETIAQHHLIVEARDSNGSGNRNTTQLLIILTDVNDQKPKFLLDQYEAFIYENELDFQSPLQVQAIDNDAQNTANSKVSYSIVGGDPQQNFTIDPSTGRIRVKSSLVLTPSSSSKPPGSDADIVVDSGGPSLVAQAAAGLDFERIAQKRDDTRQFNLTIKATDSGLPEPLSDLTHVIILVYDKNDHAPIFTRPVYSKSIREDAKEGSQVLQVLAQDGDHSPTNSKITYRISSGASDKFVIDSDSGLISVANGANLDIDRVVGGQKRTNYLLNVIAFDGSFGPNQKSSSALVNISIIDVNNKAPEFVTLGASRSNTLQTVAPTTSGNTLTTTMSSGSNLVATGSVAQQQQQQQQQLMVVYVNEDAPYGLIVTRVVASDLDSSAELRYSINYARSEGRNEDMVLVEPNLIRDLFSIDPVEGTIKVAKQLDRELFDQVKLRLQVEDIAAQTPDQVAHTYLLIKITDVNDNRPIFKKPVYKAVVNENSISGTSVITLTADDRDLNKTLRYSLDGSMEMMRLVRINPRSGEVTVNDKIDRELYPMINVTVRAEDYGHPHPLTGSAQLLITVRDENDNNPIFLNASQLASSTSNYDSSSSDITPELEPKNHNMDSTGSIYRSRSLGPAHRLGHDPAPPSLETSSSNNHHQRSSDDDRLLPLLSPGAIAKISEDSPIGYQVAYVRAEDADVGNNGRVTYLIDAASSGGKFRIDRDSGIISVAGPLDRETSKQYSLIIEACDNYDLGYSTGESRRAFTQVNIQVTDINDNAPILTTNLQSSVLGSSNGGGAEIPPSIYPTFDDIMSSPGPYEMPLADCLFINEFQALNEPILTITATDADDPNTPNGQMELAIVNNLPQNSLFRLVAIQSHANTGAAGSVSLAVANPALRSSTSTSSSVDDLSGFGADLALEESQTTTTTMNQKSTTNQQQDSRISGSPESKRLKKRDVGESVNKADLLPLEAFAHSVGGSLIHSRGSSSSSPSHQLLSNQRRNSLLASRAGFNTAIAVTETPMFAAPMLATMSSVRQSSSNLNSLNIGAQRPDAGEQQVHVVVSQSLKERVGNYSIIVRATDRGQPPLSSVKMINICVIDVNNHSPVFTRPPLNHTIRVMENATIGSYVTQVEANDLDHGLNGELQYSLKQTNIQNNNNDWQSFKIDRLTGIITTARLFNRQLKKYYTLRVQAQDFGKPTSLSSDIDINIMIVNSGSYQPEFDNQLQTLQFTENVAPGVEWFTLIATTNQDDDPALINANTDTTRPPPSVSGSQVGAPHNWIAAPCYFIVDSDDTEQIFHLDRYTHRLTNQKAIDRERKSNYTLLVQATNNCSKQPPTPIYATRPLETAARQVASPNQPINNNISNKPTSTRTRATRSATATIFDVQLGSNNSSRESLRIINSAAQTSALQNQEESQSTFNQVAVDSVLVSDKSLLKVFIKVKDVNDNAPRFTQRVYTGGITTEADFGTVFMIVQAVDADADNQVVYSIVKPIKRNLITMSSVSAAASPMTSLSSNNTSGGNGHSSTTSLAPSTTFATESNSMNNNNNQESWQQRNQNSMRQRRSPPGLFPTNKPPLFDDMNLINDIPMNEGDDLFVINPHNGEISLNFDPQKHMKGYFEFEIMANDTDGLFDSAKVFIYLLRQDQRVKFVLRLTPQELRQRLNKFRSVFGNITGAIVNIDSYKYYENHDGTVDKKKTSLYLHFVNPEDNTIIDVDKVLTLIDNNIEYLDELYKEFHVLSSEAAHLPLSSSALIDPIDQIRTGLLGVSSFLALILVLVIALCLNQRTRYERQLKAATVSAFGSSPLHLDPDFHSQTNLPNTNLHSQDPNPIWMNGYSDQEWLSGPKSVAHHQVNLASTNGAQSQVSAGIEDPDYLSSGNSDLNSLSGVNSVSQLHYNVTTTATPRDSLNSSQGRVSGSGSGSTSTTNERQALCRGAGNDRQTPQQQHGQQQQHRVEAHQYNQQRPKESEVVGVLKNAVGSGNINNKQNSDQSGPMMMKKRSQDGNSVTHSTFGAFKEVTIYTDHQQQATNIQPQYQQQQQYRQQQHHNKQQLNAHHHHQQNQQQLDQSATSQVNKIASQFNAQHQTRANNQQSQPTQVAGNQVFINNQQQAPVGNNRSIQQQRILVHANGADVNQGIIKNQQHKQNSVRYITTASGQQQQHQHPVVCDPNNTHSSQQTQHYDHNGTADDFESNLSKLSILNLETTEL